MRNIVCKAVFKGEGMPEAVTSEGAIEKVNEQENCVGLKMEIV